METSISQDFTITVAGPVAEEIILHAGIARADASWLLPDGTRTADPSIALASSLTAIAEKSRRGRIAEIPAEMVDEVRGGLLAILAETRPSEQHERARALLDVVGAEAATPPVAVELNLDEYRLTLLAALHVRTEMLGYSEEESRLVDELWEVTKLADRRIESDWSDGEGDW